MQNPFELVLFQTLSHCSSSLSVKTCITCLVKLQSCSVDKYNTEEQAPLMYDMAAGCADRWMKIHYCTLRYFFPDHIQHIQSTLRLPWKHTIKNLVKDELLTKLQKIGVCSVNSSDAQLACLHAELRCRVSKPHRNESYRNSIEALQRNCHDWVWCDSNTGKPKLLHTHWNIDQNTYTSRIINLYIISY